MNMKKHNNAQPSKLHTFINAAQDTKRSSNNSRDLPLN